MFKTGLSSSTFKYMSVDEIINVAKEAKLDGIEWDGITHIPSGDLEQAKKVYSTTRLAGLRTMGYTTDISVGMDAQNFEKFKSAFLTAKTLKAPVIRLYAGKIKPKHLTEDFFKKFILETKIFAEYAKKENMCISFEFESNTLTESNQSSLQIFNNINNNNVFLHWKPSMDMSMGERVKGLSDLLPYIGCVNVSYAIGSKLFPLITGYNEWTKYINILKESNNNYYLIIDQVLDSKVDQFYLDAKALRDLIK